VSIPPSAEAASVPPARRRRKLSRRTMQALALGMILIGVGLLIGGLFSLGLLHPGPAAVLQGAVIDPPYAAPNFQLHDQFDRPVALNDFRGKVVALTFLYTSCSDTCPLITAKLNQAYGRLGADSARLAILAVTVDPAHDTVARVHDYSVAQGMLQNWHFLVGPAAAVTPVWKAYGVAALAQPAAPATGLVTVEHSTPIYLIDPAGQARVVLDQDFAPSDLVQDVRALLAR
jgi:protein SCO1/2